MHKFNAPQTGKTQLARQKRKGEKKRHGLRVNASEKLKMERLAVSGKRTGKSKRKTLRQQRKVAKEIERKLKEDTEMHVVDGSASNKIAKKNKKNTRSRNMKHVAGDYNQHREDASEPNNADMDLE